MDIQLMQLMADETPPMNRDIVDGLAMIHVPLMEDYINNIFRSVARDFPPGLEYCGYERCTPVEEFMEETKKHTKKPTFNLAKSDFYMVKYFFRFEGEDLPPRYLYLPFVSSAGTIVISGSRYAITPVLSDKVISKCADNVFVRLNKAKLTIMSVRHEIVIDDVIVIVQNTHSTFYNLKNNRKQEKLVKAECVLVHYLLCKHGFSEMFRLYAGTVPVIGYEEINSNTYPPSDWVICKSTRSAPKGFGRGFYPASKIRLAIRRDAFNNNVKSYVSGFFYVVDHFPARILKEYVDNTRLWMVLLGYILFSKSNGEGKLYDDVVEHFQSLSEYVDIIMVDQLKEIGLDCKDIYQLLAVVIENFDQWLLGSSEKVSSMYDKEMSILYYLSEAIIISINKLHYMLRSASKKKLLAANIIKAMNKTIRPKLIYAIRVNNACTSTVAYSGDNKFFKITCMLSSQSMTNATTTSSKGQANVDDPSKRLHSSIAEVGGYSNLPGNEPTGRNRINPHLRLDMRQTVIRDPDKMPLLTAIQDAIQRK
jgi:hypothetical protein